MHIGEYCKNYRKSKGVTLKQLGGEENIKALSAYEGGRSTNIQHFFRYVRLAQQHREVHTFLHGITEVIDG